MLMVSGLREKTAILNLTDFDSQTSYSHTRVYCTTVLVQTVYVVVTTDSNTYMVTWTTSKLGLWLSSACTFYSKHLTSNHYSQMYRFSG